MPTNMFNTQVPQQTMSMPPIPMGMPPMMPPNQGMPPLPNLGQQNMMMSMGMPTLGQAPIPTRIIFIENNVKIT